MMIRGNQTFCSTKDVSPLFYSSFIKVEPVSLFDCLSMLEPGSL